MRVRIMRGSIDQGIERIRENQEEQMEQERDKRIEQMEQNRQVEIKYLENAIERLEIQCALDDVGVSSVLDYLLFVGNTINDYLEMYSTNSELHSVSIGGAYEPNPPGHWGASTMSGVLPELWDTVHDMTKGILTKDPTEVLAALAWANHLEHCSGGSLLKDHGALEFCAVDAISNGGLTAVFGEKSVVEFTDFIEVGL